jgi:hypothetical protein
MQAEHVVDELLWRREQAISRWRATHNPSRNYAHRRKAAERLRRQRVNHLISSIKIAVLLLMVLYAFRLPAVTALPKADVLTIDMTGYQDDSRSFFFKLLDDAGLTHVSYNSMGIDGLRLMTTGNYRYIILWGHSGINDMATSERYSPLYHVFEQMTGQVGGYEVAGKTYFSLQPSFIDNLPGRFQGTIIMLMGCNTLTQTDLAQSFINKGASEVIGWRGLVEEQVTDTTVSTLFQRVLVDHMATIQAVSETAGFLSSLGTDESLSAYAADGTSS